jgi:hypothetical protein
MVMPISSAQRKASSRFWSARFGPRSLSVSKRAELVRLWRLAMLATKSERIVTIEDVIEE